MQYPQLLERFLRYVSIDTQTNPSNPTLPSSAGQLELAKLLYQEMSEMGLSSCFLHDNAICGGYLAANTKGIVPVTLFAHLDTAFDQPGKVKPQVIDYEGGDIALNSSTILSESKELYLRNYRGSRIVVTSGDSLLGADDKSAISCFLSLLEYFQKNSHIKHGEIQVIFLPDEEKGLCGAKALDMSLVRGAYGICLDCGAPAGAYATETWWAAKATLTFHGVTAHTGGAKGRLVNSLLQASDFISQLPKNETPEKTAGKEGFFYLHKLDASVEKSQLKMNFRDFSWAGFAQRKELIKNIISQFEGAEVIFEDEYGNCGDQLQKCTHFFELLEESMKNQGITPQPRAMRGGFDGAALCLKGLPTLNIFSGSHNAHSIREYWSLTVAEQACAVLEGFILHVKSLVSC